VHIEAIGKRYIATTIMLVINQYILRVSLVLSVGGGLLSLSARHWDICCYSLFFYLSVSQLVLLNRLQINYLEIYNSCKL